MILRSFVDKLRYDRIVQLVIMLSWMALCVFYWWSLDKVIVPETYYEQPFLVKLFAFINFPAIALTGIVFYPFYSDSNQALTIWLYYATLIIFYLLQWSLIGIIVSETLSKFSKN